jgi:hypothetical protein
MNVSEEAIAAALAALGEAYGEDAYCRKREYVITALEAADRYMVNDVESGAWQMGYSKGYQKAWQEAKETKR